MDYKEMTKAQLVAEVEKQGLTDELKKVDTNFQKIKNEVIVKMLEGTTTVEETEDKVEETPKPKVAPKPRKMTLSDKIDFVNTAIPVVVVDHDTSVEIKDDSELRSIELGWGDRYVGYYTERIFLHGQRQYLTNGVLKHMRTLTIPNSKVTPEGKWVQLPPRPRFTITEVEGFTEAEFEALRKKQEQDRLTQG